MSGDDMTGTRQETAAEYLRAAVVTLRASAAVNAQYGVRGDRRDFERAVADWLDHTATDTESASRGNHGSGELAFITRPLAVAAAVLGRDWVPS